MDWCLGASLHLPVVMHTVYWSAEKAGFPKVDSSGGWGSSGVTIVTITKVSSARTQAGVGGVSGSSGGGCELKVYRCPVIGIGIWVQGTGS